MKTKLQLEINPDLIKDKTVKMTIGKCNISITPPVGEDYWLYRVKLCKDQAIIGFPKILSSWDRFYARRGLEYKPAI